MEKDPPPLAADPLDLDDGMDSVSARTEALAISSTFKLRGRGRTTSTSSQGNFWKVFFFVSVSPYHSSHHEPPILFVTRYCEKVYVWSNNYSVKKKKNQVKNSFANSYFGEVCFYFKSDWNGGFLARDSAYPMGFWPVALFFFLPPATVAYIISGCANVPRIT